MVPATANIFAAVPSDYFSGTLPPSLYLPQGNNRVVTFPDISGNAISCCGTSYPHDADGGTNLQTYIVPEASISGIRHTAKNMFLVGVFLTDEAPSGATPAVFGFSSDGTAGTLADDFTSLALDLGQTFFIGNGKVGADGDLQQFHVPDGATRLFLGFADGLNLGDPRFGPSPVTPSSYGDNTGAAAVTFAIIGDGTDSSLTLTFTHAVGNEVQALALNDDGWPASNAATGAPANPVTVTVTLTNTTDESRDFRLSLTLESPSSDTTPSRFYVYALPGIVACDVPEEPTYYSPENLFSYTRYYSECVLHLLPGRVDRHFPHAMLIRVALDNLNTHTKASLYEAFEPQEAKRLADKLEFRSTPQHGSWLNMAECAFAVLLRQCLDRRLGSQQLVAREVAVWEQARNAAKATVNWRFTSEIARKKLRRLYPSQSWWPTTR